MKTFIDHLAKDFVEYLVSVFAMLGQDIVQSSERPLLGRKLHRAVGQGSEETVDLINEVVAKTAASGGVQVEAHDSLILAIGIKKQSIRTLRSKRAAQNIVALSF
jgi:hypothetical protein